MTRTLVKYVPLKGSRSTRPSYFVVTFDEYHTVDTIVQDGKLLKASNAHAKVILNNADEVFAGVFAPPGFSWAGRLI